MNLRRPEPNVALWDRIFRLLMGLGLALLGILIPTWWGLLSLWFLATAAVAWEPLYRPFDFTTCRHRFDQNVCDETRD
jgi:uncharacterized membrane protein